MFLPCVLSVKQYLHMVLCQIKTHFVFDNIIKRTILCSVFLFNLGFEWGVFKTLTY